MSVNLGTKSTLAILGIVGVVGVVLFYYRSKVTEALESNPKWQAGDSLIINGQELMILDLNYEYMPQEFALDNQVYSKQWWYRLSDDEWYPQDFLK